MKRFKMAPNITKTPAELSPNGHIDGSDKATAGIAAETVGRRRRTVLL
ncbi:MAG TPA: hypothetical protein VGL72_15890 [Bryobacteraceae bacterium]